MKRSTPALRVPLWTIYVVAASLFLFLGSQFLRYESAIAGNGDIMAYKRTAIMINGLRAGIVTTVPNYYPPLANLLFLSAENNILGAPFHHALLFLFLTAMGGACVFSLLPMEERILAWFTVTVLGAIALLEPAVFFARFDFFPMLGIVLAALSLRRRMYGAAGAFLMLGCLLKLAPVFLIPVFHVLVPAGHRRAFWTGMLLTATGVLGASFLLLGVRVTLQSMGAFFTLRTAYPPYALSTASSIDLFVRMLAGGTGKIEWIGPDLGHFNTGLPVTLSAGLLLLSVVGAGYIAFLASRDRKRDENGILYISATMLWILFATPLLTMHYYLWILPLVLLWFVERLEHTWRLRLPELCAGLGAVALGLLGQWTYPTLYFDLVDRQMPLAVTVNFVRNALCLAIVISLLLATRKLRTSR